MGTLSSLSSCVSRRSKRLWTLERWKCIENSRESSDAVLDLSVPDVQKVNSLKKGSLCFLIAPCVGWNLNASRAILSGLFCRGYVYQLWCNSIAHLYGLFRLWTFYRYSFRCQFWNMGRYFWCIPSLFLLLFKKFVAKHRLRIEPNRVV